MKTILIIVKDESKVRSIFQMITKSIHCSFGTISTSIFFNEQQVTNHMFLLHLQRKDDLSNLVQPRQNYQTHPEYICQVQHIFYVQRKCLNITFQTIPTWITNKLRSLNRTPSIITMIVDLLHQSSPIRQGFATLHLLAFFSQNLTCIH